MTVIESAETVEYHRTPQVNLFFYTLGKLYFRLVGFKIIGELPDIPKMVIAAAPHTSNLDGIFLVCTMWQLRIRLVWMVKKEILWGPLGWLIRALGGMAIDRSASFNTVEQAVQHIHQSEEILLVIAPEGTRKKASYWKTGFYWIAHDANIPIVCAALDYRRKVLDLTTPPIHPTGDIEADMEKIWAVFRDVTARFPDHVADMRLRPSAAIRQNDNP